MLRLLYWILYLMQYQKYSITSHAHLIILFVVKHMNVRCLWMINYRAYFFALIKFDRYYRNAVCPNKFNLMKKLIKHWEVKWCPYMLCKQHETNKEVSFAFSQIFGIS